MRYPGGGEGGGNITVVSFSLVCPKHVKKLCFPYVFFGFGAQKGQQTLFSFCLLGAGVQKGKTKLCFLSVFLLFGPPFLKTLRCKALGGQKNGSGARGGKIIFC